MDLSPNHEVSTSDSWEIWTRYIEGDDTAEGRKVAQDAFLKRCSQEFVSDALAANDWNESAAIGRALCEAGLFRDGALSRVEVAIVGMIIQTSPIGNLVELVPELISKQLMTSVRSVANAISNLWTSGIVETPGWRCTWHNGTMVARLCPSSEWVGRGIDRILERKAEIRQKRRANSRGKPA